MKIAGIQISSVVGDREANFKKVESFFQEIFAVGSNTENAVQNGTIPDIVILPEVWTTGWDCSIFEDLKEADGKTEEFLSALAKKYNVNIIGGSYIKDNRGGINGQKARNHCPVFNREGKKIAFYEKIHLYSPDGEAKAVESGKKPVIVEIEGLKIGLSICYDIRFPELFRSYINFGQENGARQNNAPQMLLNMSAWPKTRSAQYTAMATAHAIQNQCYFMALSQTGLIKNGVYNAGNSLCVEPMGNIINRLGEEEGILYAEIKPSRVNEVRGTYPNLQNRKVFDFGFRPELAGVELSV